MVAKRNNFHANDQEAKEVELGYLSRLYESLTEAPDDSYTYTHDENPLTKSLQRHGVDVTVRISGKDYWYDNKIVKCPKDKFKVQDSEGNTLTITTPYTDMCYETLSCSIPGKEKDGWGAWCLADRLSYAFEQIFPNLPTFYDTWVLQDMPGFKKWVWGNNITRYRYHTMLEENRTRCVLIPIREILKAFPDTERYLIFETHAQRVHKNVDRPITEWISSVKNHLEKDRNKIIPIRKEAS